MTARTLILSILISIPMAHADQDSLTRLLPTTQIVVDSNSANSPFNIAKGKKSNIIDGSFVDQNTVRQPECLVMLLAKDVSAKLELALKTHDKSKIEVASLEAYESQPEVSDGQTQRLLQGQPLTVVATAERPVGFVEGFLNLELSGWGITLAKAASGRYFAIGCETSVASLPTFSGNNAISEETSTVKDMKVLLGAHGVRLLVPTPEGDKASTQNVDYQAGPASAVGQ